MCKHEVEIKLENGNIITYCKKCGAILDTKPAHTGPYNDAVKIRWSEAGIKDNGGDILHD